MMLLCASGALGQREASAEKTPPATAEKTSPPASGAGTRAEGDKGEARKPEWWRMPRGVRPRRAVSAGAEAICHECYPPFAAGVMPLVTPRSVSRIGGDLVWGFRSVGGGTAWLMTYNLEGEIAAVPERFAIGFRLDAELVSLLGGGGGGNGALRSVGLGFKGTLYDDRRGNALGVVLAATVVNTRADGVHADAVSLGGGVFGALRVKMFHLLAVLGAAHGFAVLEGLGATDAVQWGLQPTFRVAGPHHVGLVLAGAAQLGGAVDRHLVDLSAGYVHASDGFKGAFLLGFPLTNRDLRASVQLQVKAGWEF